MSYKEIEAKIKVPDFESLKKRMYCLGALRIGKTYEKNILFSIDDNCILRLRVVDDCMGSKGYLTYKGPLQESRLKIREELETEIGNFENMYRIIKKLFKEIGQYKKERETYRIAYMEIALDYLPGLGNFVEIEGKNEREIFGCIKKLGLKDLPLIKESYLELLLNQRSHKKREDIQPNLF